MTERDAVDPRKEPGHGFVDAQGASRRDFLRASTLAALAALGGSAGAAEIVSPLGMRPAGGRGNQHEGRIVLFHDPQMGGHLTTPNKYRIQQAVSEGVRVLTGIDSAPLAFESLFPGLQATSKIAIKVNCIGVCATRWEVVRGIVYGLSLMRDFTYDISQVTIYDSNNLPADGYIESEFTFGGHTAVISSTSNPSNYYVYGSHRLSNYLLQADYVIDVPVLKSHDNPNNMITVALKNHYGSCSPQTLCGNIPGMLTVNSDPNVKDKTCLVVTSALRGTYNGGPNEPAQIWLGYPEQTPNTIFLTTDPVTNEYWARETINAERLLHGWSQKTCPWVEEASGAPYNLGVSDPDQMTVIQWNAADAPDGPDVVVGGTYLVGGAPNPFRDRTALRFRMARPGEADLRIVAADGRLVRQLGARRHGEGYGEIIWDGRDDAGRRLSPGVYFARMAVDGQVSSRRVILAR